jgi:hypothetical protein
MTDFKMVLFTWTGPLKGGGFESGEGGVCPSLGFALKKKYPNGRVMPCRLHESELLPTDVLHNNLEGE